MEIRQEWLAGDVADITLIDIFPYPEYRTVFGLEFEFTARSVVLLVNSARINLCFPKRFARQVRKAGLEVADHAAWGLWWESTVLAVGRAEGVWAGKLLDQAIMFGPWRKHAHELFPLTPLAKASI